MTASNQQTPQKAGFVFNLCKMLTSLQNNESVEVN
jgi:hypothetical protein